MVAGFLVVVFLVVVFLVLVWWVDLVVGLAVVFLAVVGLSVGLAEMEPGRTDDAELLEAAADLDAPVAGPAENTLPIST